MSHYHHLMNLVNEMAKLVDEGEETWDAWIIVCDKNKLNQRNAQRLYQLYEDVMARRSKIYSVTR